MRPLLLDLFCGAGGAALGYYRAGFSVVGIDFRSQPRYPGEFHQLDCRVLLGDSSHPWWRRVVAVHASPPCQAHSDLAARTGKEYPDLLDETREALVASGLPWVIENVEGAPLRRPVRLCGSAFGLGVRRHRLFEANVPILGLPCHHERQPEPIDVTGTGARQHKGRPGWSGGRSRKPRSLAEARQAMGIGWMTRRELSEAIPPAYTEFLGDYLLRAA